MNDQQITSTIVARFRHELRNNFFALISVGTVTTIDYRSGWSDIDLLIVVKTLNLRAKQAVAKAKYRLEKQLNVPIGLYVITRKESLHPAHPDFALDGKTLQALFELRRWPNRQWYPQWHVQWYVPSGKMMRAISLANVFFFLRRNRRTLSSKILTKNISALRNVVAKELKAGFIVTKLALQSRGRLVPESKRDMVLMAKTEFVGHNFRVLEDGLRLIPDWHKIRSYQKLLTLLSRIDAFLETFPAYASQSPR